MRVRSASRYDYYNNSIYDYTYTAGGLDVFDDGSDLENAASSDAWYAETSAGCEYVTFADADGSAYNANCDGCQNEDYEDNLKLYGSTSKYELPRDLQEDLCGVFVHIKS